MLGSFVFFGASSPGITGTEDTLPTDRIAQADSVVLERVCQHLAKRRTILAIRCLRHNQVVLRHRQVAFLLQNVGRRRSSKVIFLLLRFKTLSREFASCERRLNLRTIVRQRELAVDNLDANLDINLFQAQLVLPVFQHRTCLRRSAPPGCGSGC